MLLADNLRLLLTDPVIHESIHISLHIMYRSKLASLCWHHRLIHLVNNLTHRAVAGIVRALTIPGLNLAVG
jgi:hypothetical protein